MIKNNLLWVAVSLVLLSLFVIYGIRQNNFATSKSIQEIDGGYTLDPSDIISEENLITVPSLLGITEEERAGLVLMREEEKLARDVYLHLGEKWGMNIFYNIAESEQTHTDTVKILLDRYGIEDPVKDDNLGEFTSLEMSSLYKDLIQKGETSLVEALTVGAIVEDLDIRDLETLLNQTGKEDIILTYKNLQKGSRNHLRAYSKNLDRRGITYVPQYISEEAYLQIVSSEQESGIVK